ncbi:ead/Ea22-like family protein [Salmonella enterica]|uniref:Ead/Ea22-like family protein n=1 Tax=Salmonella enterica TaxID=28901 RepID=A0A5V2A4Y7_SALER|nr:ead/Ea22-like family protein [Salmonella enterica subsp. enterica serovar Cerro]
MGYISQFEASDIDSDDIDLRFEVDAVETGTTVSIVDECGHAAQIITSLLDELEHYKSREERVTKLVLDNSTSWDALYKKLEATEHRIAEHRKVLNSLAAVARRYLPDYDEHPEIQAADELLESAAGIKVIEGEGQ